MKIAVWPRPDGTPGVPISVGVTWVYPEEMSISWVYLGEAYDAFSAGSYWQMLVPVFVSYEIGLMGSLRVLLGKVANKEKVKTFMTDALGASDALNMLLPLACSFLNARPLPEQIREELNRLRPSEISSCTPDQIRTAFHKR